MHGETARRLAASVAHTKRGRCELYTDDDEEGAEDLYEYVGRRGLLEVVMWLRQQVLCRCLGRGALPRLPALNSHLCAMLIYLALIHPWCAGTWV